MNRDHVQATGATGGPAPTRRRSRCTACSTSCAGGYPDVEIESCSSGGARIDLGILTRTDRVWTSDCNDALERQTIQRHASTLIPPSVMGCHVGPPRAHTTGRTQSLGFRAATALFGHFGIEWNLLHLDEAERAELAEWVARYKQHRDLLHGGDVLRVDHDGHTLVHGVLAPDRRRGLVAYAQLTTAQALAPRPVRVPELDPDARYHVELVSDGHGGGGRWLTRSSLAVTEGVVLTGRQLANHGVRLPAVLPESVVLISLEAVA